MAKRISIVILNWNGEKMLQKYLPTVVRLSEEFADIWIADNASTDNSLSWVQTYCPSVKVVCLDKNYGFAEGYNKALEHINTEYYVLLNSDVEVTEGWLQPLVALMDEHPEIGACQPKLLGISRRTFFEYAGASGGYIDKYGYPFCRGRIMDCVEEDSGQYDDTAEIHWATGACLFIRSKSYWSVGGLDARFFAHNEEIDLCWRLRLQGQKVMVEPKSHVYHVGGGTLPKSNPMKTYLNFRNNLTMLYKNLPEKELKHVMRVRFWLDYIAAFKMLVVDRNFSEAKAVWRGRRDFIRWRHEFDEDRRNIGKSHAKSFSLLKPYSILWKYYVRGMKKYSMIK